MVDLYKCSLRPLAIADLQEVLTWRNSDRIRKVMYSDHIISWEEHKAWFDKLQYRNNRKCLLFEYEDRPVGLLSFTDIDNTNKTAFWGFYLSESSPIKGLGLSMGILAIDYAFKELDIRKLYGEAICSNQGSIRYHNRLGFKEEGRFIKHVLKNEQLEDVVRFALFREQWQDCRFEILKAI